MSTAFGFRVTSRCPGTEARTAVLETPHGPVETPVFMPVGTRGTVKGIQPEELRETGSRMILANAYHLHLRPGEDVVRELGGLHRFMNWDGPILTDSGGYQVFSMQDITRVDEDGATLRSIVDGRTIRLTPESVIDIEHALGADVAMAFDHCESDPCDRTAILRSTERTHRWLERCVRRWHEHGGLESGQALFGIVQGGAFEDLRRSSAEVIASHDLVGHAIGGVSVGEGREAKLLAVEAAVEVLPEEKPRYLMGVGTPVDFLDAVERGIDMFDCVTPTRHGRNHQAYTSAGRINLRNERWRLDTEPIEADCDCRTCRGYSRGYLRHLCRTNEMLSGILVTQHNLSFFHRLLAELRAGIRAGDLESLRGRFERANGRA